MATLTVGMYFLIEDDALLKNVLIFGIKSALVWKKEVLSKPIYNEIFLKTKLKSYSDEV